MSMISGRVRSVGMRMALVWAGLAAALLLSISLAAGLCPEVCKATHQWTIFGMPFPFFGIGFFAICLLLFHLRDRPPARVLLAYLIAGAWGAEATFLYVQHSVIKIWCPICLAVALCVLLAGIALAIAWFPGMRKQFGSGRGASMRYLSRGAFLAAVMIAGSYISFLGLGNPAVSHAETLPLALGKLDSDVEVYVFTDWFCPACRKAEPEMERAYPDIMTRAKLLFIDIPIHAETMNFIPYNLSFLVREKAKYLEIRKTLLRLAERTKEPTPEDIQKAVAPLGVAYRPLNYADVNAGVQYFQSVTQAFRVEGTPAMAVYNRKTKTTRVLNGTQDLSYPYILMAISGVAPP
ncbi:MAG: vitamin K epoxide reductase family protein [Candidatus Deferrimicrobiaceae bacterium]